MKSLSVVLTSAVKPRTIYADGAPTNEVARDSRGRELGRVDGKAVVPPLGRVDVRVEAPLAILEPLAGLSLSRALVSCADGGDDGLALSLRSGRGFEGLLLVTGVERVSDVQDLDGSLKAPTAQASKAGA